MAAEEAGVNKDFKFVPVARAGRAVECAVLHQCIRL
jgi:hypothetical protein